AMKAAVPAGSANLKAAAIAKTPAKISLATSNAIPAGFDVAVVLDILRYSPSNSPRCRAGHRTSFTTPYPAGNPMEKVALLSRHRLAGSDPSLDMKWQGRLQGRALAARADKDGNGDLMA